MNKADQLDPSMERVNRWYKASGLTQQELGEKMGFPVAIARQSAWQFLQGKDPRISTLRRFAEASGIELAELVASAPMDKMRSLTAKLMRVPPSEIDAVEAKAKRSRAKKRRDNNAH